MTKIKDPRFTDEYYDNLLYIKKTCAARMKSKTHDDQIEKFIDYLWLDGSRRDDIVAGVVYAYGVNTGYAETMVNCYLNMMNVTKQEEAHG